jgi:hypothetical protein
MGHPVRSIVGIQVKCLGHGLRINFHTEQNDCFLECRELRRSSGFYYRRRFLFARAAKGLRLFGFM